MELNREQAIDILERFDFFQGQRAGRLLWQSKNFDVQEQDIADFSRDVALLKNYIKELTEENERLRTENEFLLNIKNLNIDKVQADTVRKMAERLKQTICDNTYPDFNKAGKPVNIWKSTTGYDLIDQIAKEIINESTAT